MNTEDFLLGIACSLAYGKLAFLANSITAYHPAAEGLTSPWYGLESEEY